MAVFHQPVLLQEVCSLLQPRPGDVMVDLNLGTGGHSLALIEASERQGKLISFDLDEAMIETARERFRAAGVPEEAYEFIHANHGDVAEVLASRGITQVDKILMDLGASSIHFDDPERGFSCQVDGPLDMRYDRSEGDTAADIVNGWDEEELANLFYEEGDEKWSRRVAKRVVERRMERRFERTLDLAEVVAGSIPRKAWPPKIHPATRVFLALRVAVNGEVTALRNGMESALQLLAAGGRLAVITFQSHEDRTVKRKFREICSDLVDENDPFGRVLQKAGYQDLARRPLVASAAEAQENPRSRSAKLRGVAKISR
jgi:16S rRNA (cytosine1402-N4)-methyltransferase